MAGEKLDGAKSGTVDFALSVVPKGYGVAVIVFGERGAVVRDPTSDAGTIARKISGLKCGVVGGTTFIGNGLNVVAKVPYLSHVLIVTDGVANDPDRALAVASKLKASGVEILTLGTPDADAAFLASLASRPDMSVSVNDSGIRAALGIASQLLLSNGVRA